MEQEGPSIITIIPRRGAIGVIPAKKNTRASEFTIAAIEDYKRTKHYVFRLDYFVKVARVPEHFQDFLTAFLNSAMLYKSVTTLDDAEIYINIAKSVNYDQQAFIEASGFSVLVLDFNNDNLKYYANPLQGDVIMLSFTGGEHYPADAKQYEQRSKYVFTAEAGITSITLADLMINGQY